MTNYVNSLTLSARRNGLVVGGPLPAQALTKLMSHGKRLIGYLKQPRSLAAAFQSVVYGGFVPAGGLFASLTSMGMLGTLAPLFLGVAALVATAVTVMVWGFRVRRWRNMGRQHR
ncbi:hypothetical protein HO133_010955 [Letharia lupina]|uniref:Uncharacterized protein n=1 Tax=Letharia lupina TaxID=560253 RepID=A0A8H6CJ12_9LECA|nr:uncharacterized protein HO133_010955 [Letharia lupina]KAF6224378.1 hypothetical protein HO133_010955 [Letharia lupina]